MLTPTGAPAAALEDRPISIHRVARQAWQADRVTGTSAARAISARVGKFCRMNVVACDGSSKRGSPAENPKDPDAACA
jgi:hypothetical protein